MLSFVATSYRSNIRRPYVKRKLNEAKINWIKTGFDSNALKMKNIETKTENGKKNSHHHLAHISNMLGWLNENVELSSIINLIDSVIWYIVYNIQEGVSHLQSTKCYPSIIFFFDRIHRHKHKCYFQTLSLFILSHRTVPIPFLFIIH